MHSNLLSLSYIKSITKHSILDQMVGEPALINPTTIDKIAEFLFENDMPVDQICPPHRGDTDAVIWGLYQYIQSNPS